MLFMRDFIFQSTPRVLFGVKSTDLLADEIEKLGGKSIFFVCDPAIKKSNRFTEILKSLNVNGLKIDLYSDIKSDPDFENADDARNHLINAKSDLVVGIGGGSAMDIAKVIAITVKTGKDAKSLTQNSVISSKGLPLILIPTTAGTGSEVTHISIFSDNEDKLKTGIVNPFLYADVAILDPEITVSLPKSVTAFSGMDAIIHALEALTSKTATPLTDLLATEAFKILVTNITDAFLDGNNLEARSDMLYGSMLAGKAFANSSVAAVHAFAYPIGAEFHIPHGVANSIMLIPVLKFNVDSDLKKYCLAAKAIGIESVGKTESEIAGELITKLDNLITILEIDRHLKQYGVVESDIPRLASSVMKITRLLSNNPRTVSLSDAEMLYREAL